MRHHLRLALPPLATLAPHSPIAFALLDRHGRVLRSGELSLEKMATALPTRQAYGILHPDDAVVAVVEVPPLPTSRLDAAVRARVEPMTLSDLQSLCVAHGPRQPDGRVQVAWTSRRTLLAAWQHMHEAGLDVRALVPLALALPEDDPQPDQPLALPADARWQAPLPEWSLARPEWRPARHSHRWRSSLRWACAATLLWVCGLHLHAAQLRDEVQTVQAHMEHTVRTAFPAIPVLLDPLRQTRAEVERMQREHGQNVPDDFLPLSLETARILSFAAGHVKALHYGDDQLTLTLAEGYDPPTDETALQQRAAAAGLRLDKDSGNTHTWHVRRSGDPTMERRP